MDPILVPIWETVRACLEAETATGLSPFPALLEARHALQEIRSASSADGSCKKSRPMLTIKVQGRSFLGLLDTGADRSIIRQQEWPSAWPTCKAEDPIRGIGQISAPMLSATALHWADEEGHQGSFQPYVLALPVSLWGRDILTQMDITLTSGCSSTSKRLLKGMGYIPGKGLGASLQGRTVPIQAASNYDKQGLGFS
ncbi:endogenous retrovirus group K member 7 Pro protein-like [Tamandua tetradactyla]|uniref:endogenous retrovirus group K member 7 Pro protein-like n=1 Tax=Tamandua tetradactyla TaxID=48850 RepID=UPI004053D3D4